MSRGVHKGSGAYVKCAAEQLKSAGEIARMSVCLRQGWSVDRDMTFSTEDVTPLESTQSRKSESSISRGTTSR